MQVQRRVLWASLFLLALLAIAVLPVAAADPPNASFSGTPTTGTLPFTVSFSDLSSNTPAGWAWFFGDENFTAPWTSVNASGGWTARSQHSSVAMPDGSILLMGGYGSSSGYMNDTWRSPDNGTTWTNVNASGGWTARYDHTSVAMPDGSIVLMGGYDDGNYKNDVWRSTDNGAMWTQVNASAGWSARTGHSSVAMADGSIVLMGGTDGSNYKNDTWRSTDNGDVWTRVNASDGWSARTGHRSVAMSDGSIVLIGGYDGNRYNDTWRSTDNGATWTNITGSPGWTARQLHSSVAMPDGSIVLMGGNDGIQKNDTWRSTNNGATWTQVNASPGWSGRYSHSSVAMPDGSIVLMGGAEGLGLTKNDVWRFNPTGSSAQSPSHTYTTAGKYNVTLQAYNSGGYNSTRKIGYIDVTNSDSIGITACRVIASPGSYQLQNNIGSSTTCIKIASSDVILDGNGYAINGTKVGSTYGIHVYNSSHVITNVTVNDITLSNWYDGLYTYNLNKGFFNNITAFNNTAGIWADTSHNLTITNITAYGNTYGIYLKTSNYDLVSDIYSHNNGNGIYILGGSNSTIANSTLSDNPTYGLLITTSSNYNNVTGINVTGTSSTSNGAIYIDNSDDNRIINNTVSRNYNGFRISGSENTTVINNTAVFNNNYGFWFSGSIPNSICQNNTASNNLGYGINAGTADYSDFSFNTALNNSITGILVSGSFTNVTHNTASWNRNHGLSIDRSNATVSNNIAETNSMAGIYTGGYNTTINNNRLINNTQYGISTINYGHVIFDNEIDYSKVNGIYMNGYSGTQIFNNTIRNSTSLGIYIFRLEGIAQNILKNNTVDRSGTNGIDVFYTNNVTIVGNTITTSSNDGIAMSSSMGSFGDCSILNNTVSNSTRYGINLESSQPVLRTTISGNIVEKSQNTGIRMNTAYNITVYNNWFNNTQNIYIVGSPVNSWNTTKTAGTNIIGGSYLGGNYWAQPNGQGFSQVHSDTDGDGIANTEYILPAANIDHLPLTNNFSAPLIPVASFTSNITFGTAPLAIQFNDTSTNTPTSWNWSFKNVAGNNTQVWWSTARNATQTFGAGNFSIAVNASNSAGYSISTQVTFINITATGLAPVANFTGTPTTGNATLIVTFTDSSTNTPTSWNWSFGDATYSTTQNPSHTYTTAGTYTVSLNATNAFGSNTKTLTGYITVSSSTAYYSVGQIINPGASVYIGEQGLNVTHSLNEGSPNDGNIDGIPVNTTIGWWASSADVEISSPTKTIDLSTRYRSIFIDPADFVGYTGTWYVINGTHPTQGAANSKIFKVVDPSLDMSVWDFTTSATVSGSSVSRNDNLGFRITTNLIDAINSSHRTPIYNDTRDGYLDIRVKNPSGTLITSLKDKSGVGHSLLQQNVSFQPWTWGNVSSASSNWSVGVLNGSGGYEYPQGAYTVWVESGLNNMRSNYKNSGVEYTGKTISPVYTVTLSNLVPVAGFTGSPTSGTAPLTVSFTDGSLNTTGWAWFFGDENFTAPWTQTKANNAVGWTARDSHTSVVMPDGSIVLMGGEPDSNDVWRSTDNGTTWTQMTAAAGWSARHAHSSVVMPDGSIVITGGYTGAGLNDVWRSTDNGATWTLMTASPGWAGRGGHSTVAMPDGSIVLMGGLPYIDDVWRSTDKGATWTQMTAHAGWGKRYGHSSVVMPDGSIVLMGGNRDGSIGNDVWRSTDKGATWTQMTAHAGWNYRLLHSSVVMPDGSIVLMGGYTFDSGNDNDVWRSTDNGAIWVRVNSSAGWLARQSHSSVPMPDGSILVMGGKAGSVKNDVWQFQPVGSSTQNPSHTYTAAGTYQVALQAFNTGGFNSTRKIGYITVTGTTPVTSFSANVTNGTVPFAVQFNDTSTGSPTSWNWDFGDANTSTLQNPVYTFVLPQVFNVTLKATNLAGSATSAITQITGFGKKVETTTVINGTTESTVSGKQVLSVNTTTIESTGGSVTNTSTTITITGGNTFWNNTQLFAENVALNTTTGDYTVTNMTQVVMQSAPVSVALNESVGTVSVSLDVALKQYVSDAPVNITITQGATTNTVNAFQLAAQNSGLNLNEIAYTVQFTNTGSINANLTQNTTRQSQAVILTMNVKHSWVARFANSTNNDGRDSIAILRSPDTGSSKVLTTRFDHYDSVTDLDWFEADSPDGLSIFGMIGYSAQQASSSQSSGNSGSSSGGYSGSYGTKKTDDKTDVKEGVPPKKAPNSPTQFFKETATLSPDKSGLLPAEVQVQSIDQVALITLPQGIQATDTSGQPLTEISLQPEESSTIPPREPGTQYAFSGLAYKCWPDGAQFSPSVTLTFTLTPDQWSNLHVNGREPVIRTYSTSVKSWETLATNNDPETLTVSTEVPHFSDFALFSKPVQNGKASAVTPAQNATVGNAAKPPANAFEIMTGLGLWGSGLIINNPLIAVIGIIVIGIGYVGWVQYRKKKEHDLIMYGRRK